MKLTLDVLLPKIKEIACKAGRAIMKIYENEADIGIQHKADTSPLTKADQKANAIICAGLEKMDIRYPIISEENKTIPFSERKNFETCWLVDPLDGTKEFIKRNGEFTVNIALIHKHEVVLGVVHAPSSKDLFWATRGGGAYASINDREPIRLMANRITMKDRGLKLVCSRSHLNEDTASFVERFTAPKLVSKGSSLKFLIIAKGEADIYPRLAPTMEWDTGAAQIILEEAGGKVVKYSDHKPLDYNKEDLLNPHFVAYADLIS